MYNVYGNMHIAAALELGPPSPFGIAERGCPVPSKLVTFIPGKLRVRAGNFYGNLLVFL